MQTYASICTAAVFVLAGTIGLSQGSDAMPVAARKALDLRHPGWKLVEISKENRAICFNSKSPFQPTLVWGDFDGDGQKDYAALVTAKGHTFVVILLKRKDAYTTFDVFTPTKPRETPPDLLSVMPQSGAYAHETVLAQYCESSTLAFTYTAAGFKRKILGD